MNYAEAIRVGIDTLESDAEATENEEDASHWIEAARTLRASEASIHELFKAVKEHPDFMFGTIFVLDDVPPEKHRTVRGNEKVAEEALVREGFDFIENFEPVEVGL